MFHPKKIMFHAYWCMCIHFIVPTCLYYTQKVLSGRHACSDRQFSWKTAHLSTFWNSIYSVMYKDAGRHALSIVSTVSKDGWGFLCICYIVAHFSWWWHFDQWLSACGLFWHLHLRRHWLQDQVCVPSCYIQATRSISVRLHSSLKQQWTILLFRVSFICCLGMSILTFACLYVFMLGLHQLHSCTFTVLEPWQIKFQKEIQSFTRRFTVWLSALI